MEAEYAGMEEEDEEKQKRITPTSIAPITFFVRDEADWIPNEDFFEKNKALSPLSHGAQKILQFLKNRGASFFSDVVRGTLLLEAEVENSLWELVAVGAITADSFDNLRSLIDPKRRLNRSGRRGRTRYSSASWSLLAHANTFQEDLSNTSVTDAPDASSASKNKLQLEALCWVLLKRYGVVFRDLLAREKNLPRWRELLVILRRLEDHGEIRGGRFVDGFHGEQFALPYAVDSISAFRNQAPNNEIIGISAMDPLNLIGIILPGSNLPQKRKLLFKMGFLIIMIN